MSRDKELTETIFSMANELEDILVPSNQPFTHSNETLNHHIHSNNVSSNLLFEFFILNHHGSEHANLYEFMDDLRKRSRYSISQFIKHKGWINETLLNDSSEESEEEIFEFVGNQTYFDQFKRKAKLPNETIELQPFISESIPLYFSYKEFYFPLKDAPVVFKQTHHVASLLRESYYRLLKIYNGNEKRVRDKSFILLLEDDFPVCEQHMKKLIQLLRISQLQYPENLCGIFMGTGGSSILMNSSVLPHLSQILRKDPTFENGRLFKNEDGSIRPLPHDVMIQSCLLGEFKDCREDPVLRNCKSIVSDRLFFRHAGEKAPTDKFLSHKGNKWQCGWRNPLTSSPSMPPVVLYQLLQ
ncbi:hypothetical protein C9374_012771 [Naegleria lovaniensis]|uniref:Uncharacterized protein n=1 Tax=Naegleria lovaniensis TaxID=51637 RepID=A0AA88GEK0_NAELO|nr:uncharacterized protein C9374_012771 [Naegleria lovaniensis]KAG2373169.1 hypothetical protein C9374_012771 [Naegleria lovaniensis]